jgi:DNA repair protein SbcD/Mre11
MMSRNGFRFIHATGLCLDEPLRGTAAGTATAGTATAGTATAGTGPLSGKDRTLAEEATFLSWRGIVETCLNAQADFLLLTGNSFDARTDSLRARVALLEGFEKLASHGVDVYVVPGILDPTPAWTGSATPRNGAHHRSNVAFEDRRTTLHGDPSQPSPRPPVPPSPRPLSESLPPNVTLISGEPHEPIAVIREDRLVASVFVVASAETGPTHRREEDETFPTHQAPYRIGIIAAGASASSDNAPTRADAHVAMSSLPLVQAAVRGGIEYLAWGDGIVREERHARTVMHDPGCAQPLSSTVGGPHGCSIVDVSPEGETRIERVVTAPVRRERIRIEVEGHLAWNDLVERMALALVDRAPEPAERLWLIEWNVTGSGEVLDLLAEEASRSELWEQLEAELEGEASVRRVHRLVSEPEMERSVATSENGLLDDFNTLLDELDPEDMHRLHREMLDAVPVRDASREQLGEFLRRVPVSRTMARSRLLAAGWLE